MCRKSPCSISSHAASTSGSTPEIEGRPEIWLGRVRWVVLVENRSTVPIEGVVPEINFSDGLRLRGAPIERIEPGAVGRSLVEGKTKAREGGELGFTLTISEAYW